MSSLSLAQPVVIANEPSQKKTTVPYYHQTYLGEDQKVIEKVDDSVHFNEAIADKNSDKWIQTSQAREELRLFPIIASYTFNLSYIGIF